MASLTSERTFEKPRTVARRVRLGPEWIKKTTNKKNSGSSTIKIF